MRRLLFLCTGNSCRSQMAEGWARHTYGDSMEMYSAGTAPHRVDPRAIQVMTEAGVDISSQTSNHLDEYLSIPFDLVVTVCDSARESCPVFPGGGKKSHRSFEDSPAFAKSAGSEEETLEHYRRVREEIRCFVSSISPGAGGQMKTIGIIGGMSWESTALYYRLISEGIRDRLGGLHSGSILLDSVDFAPMEKLQAAGDWTSIGRILSDKASKLQDSGAEGILIATNTMHEVADVVEGAIRVPFLHIADAVGEALTSDGLDTVGLLGTRFTMERPFYTGRLMERFGINTLIPESDGRDQVHKVIYQELCRGVIEDSSKSAYLQIMDKLVEDGAQAIVLGCTEIGLLVGEEDTDIPLYDTARFHAEAAVRWMLGNGSA